MTEVSHEQAKSLIGAYVLGSVPSEELASVRAHILACSECTAEADRLSSAVEALSFSVDPVIPPPAFTRDLMGRVAQEGADATGLAPRRSRWNPLVALSFAAVVVVTAVLAAVAFDARKDAEANRKVATAILAAAQGIQLQGESGVVAKLVPTESGAVFVATGLEELASDRIYQLWFIRDGAPVSAGTFDVSQGVGVLRTSRSSRRIQGAAVTVEPGGGSEQPTTEPVIRSG